MTGKCAVRYFYAVAACHRSGRKVLHYASIEREGQIDKRGERRQGGEKEVLGSCFLPKSGRR